MQFEHQVWWGLHGPREFMKAALGTLQAGHSVVMLLPEHAPPEIDEVLRDCLKAQTYLGYVGVDVRPGERVRRRLCEVLGQDVTARVSRALSRRDLRQSVIHFTGIPGEIDKGQAAIASLLDQAASLGEDPRRRPRLLFSLRSRADCQSLERQIGRSGQVKVMGWRDVLKRTDIGAYVGALMHERKGPGALRLFQSVVWHLAGFDRGFADKLSTLADKDLLDIENAVRDLAGELPPIDGDWASGGHDFVDGEEIMHPVRAIQLAMDPSTPSERAQALQKGVRDLIWRAHLSEIFPWLEAVRHDVIEAFYRRPIKPLLQRGVIRNRYDEPFDSIEDLEYSNLWHVIKKQLIEPCDADGFVSTAARVRNELAHRRPVNAHMIERLVRSWDNTDL